jgi:hypothetical protein
MMLLLTFLVIVAGTGFAMYCMVCERLAAHRRREAVATAGHPLSSSELGTGMMSVGAREGSWELKNQRPLCGESPRRSGTRVTSI